MALAVYGKHPAKGDFLEYGLPAALKPALEGWLDTVLAEAKSSLGADWQTVWPAAPMLRFWLGEGIWGAPVAGVMASAQDRVGRRFPLVLMALGEAGLTLPPPVINTDQTWYDAACSHLGAQLQRHDLSAPADLVQHAPQPAMTDAPPGQRDFWAVRPGADVAGLLADIALTDHRRANEGRSYWWVAGTNDAIVEERDAEPVVSLEDDPEGLPAPQIKAQDDGIDDAEEPMPEVDPPNETFIDGDKDADHWEMPDLPETDASPFSGDTNGLSLFAAPEPGGIVEEIAYVAPQIQTLAAAKPMWSQVWAGPGLPSGAVLAWFFRGHAGND